MMLNLIKKTKKEIIVVLTKKKLPAERYPKRNVEREKDSGQKKISDVRYMDHMRIRRGRRKCGKNGEC